MARIIAYSEKTEVSNDDYLLLDSSTGGTKKINANTLLAALTVETLIGDTPITLTEETDIKLIGGDNTEYSISGFKVIDYEDNDGVTFNNVTVSTAPDGRMDFTATGDAWNTCYTDIRMYRLTPGVTYTLTVTRGAYTSGYTSGYYVIYDTDGNNLGTLDFGGDDSGSLRFTATMTNARIRFYPVIAYYWETYGLRTARISSIEVTESRSGVFNGSIKLGTLPAGITVSSTPSSMAYSITQKGETKVDTALSMSSRNPVQNKIITAAMGLLANLNTTNKDNLVSAINEAAASSASRLNGKRCVFLGDSVSAFQNPPNDIPSMVGATTGMSVVNGAFGGCRITDTVTDEYGSFSFVKLVDAIVSGDWTQQDADVSTLDNVEDAYSPTDHLTALKAVNWNNIDILVIHWAGNDPGNVRIDDPNNEENTAYYLGAFRYGIRKLWRAFPQLKILYANCTYHEWPSLNLNTDDRTYTIDGQTYHYYDWCDAILEEAKKIKIPTLDLYRTSCFTPYNIAYYMTSDRTHPNTIGNRALADKFTAKLLSEF